MNNIPMKFDYSKTLNEQLPTFEYYKNRYCSYGLQISQLQQENQQLKEQVEYLRRSCERKEDTIISLEQDLTIIDELEKWIKDLSTEKINSFGDKGKCVAIWNYAILDKINELKDRDIK